MATTCPGLDVLRLRPQDVSEAECPRCGQAVEVWPDERERACPSCGARVVNAQSAPTCRRWCVAAGACRALAVE